MGVLHHIETGFQLIVQYGVLLLECFGVAILLVTALKSMAGYIRRSPHVRLDLAQGIQGNRRKSKPVLPEEASSWVCSTIGF